MSCGTLNLYPAQCFCPRALPVCTGGVGSENGTYGGDRIKKDVETFEVSGLLQ